MGVYTELERRGLIAQVTHPEKVKDLLENDKISFYIGFDPTADSLHVGHFLQMVIMAHMQRAGHRPIALMGGGTAMIGDPSGRTDMRKMLTKEDIDYNVSCFKKQFQGLIDFSEGKALMVNNGDWLLNLNYVEFLRDIGVHFSVNNMLRAECFKKRLEKGLSFLEFNYMLMQGYDFYKLHKDYGCKIELGGDDQWSNILAGMELVRRKDAEEVYGMTFALLTTSAGVKMGKTQGGAVWLDPNKTSPFEFYQYWRNVDDADVYRCLKMLTFISVEEIEAMEDKFKTSGDAKDVNEAKATLAHELTKMVHGIEEADKAKEAAQALFANGGNTADMPSSEMAKADFENGMAILDVMLAAGLIPSKGEGRRLVQQGGVSVNNEKITDPFANITLSMFENDEIIIKKGKKTYHKIIVK
ncbi:MAG: tyrosine--tRNA ligase [Clostridia bacterium]|nr:tyrosine--tRNA ligase [Clostridia bacterium]